MGGGRVYCVEKCCAIDNTKTKMKGLRTQESKEFNAFFKIIQDYAQTLGYVFFAYAGDGREVFAEGIEGEDMMGWLVPDEKADEFEKFWNLHPDDSDYEEWGDCFVWAEWSMDNGKIEISFNAY